MSEQAPSPNNSMLWARRAGHLAAEVLIIFAILIVLGLGILLWRLQAGPIDMGFAKDYIQSALRNPERNIYVTVGKVVLHWPDMKGPMLLGLSNVRVYDDKQKKIIVGVSQADLELSMAGLLIGKIAPVSLVLKNPSLRVIRNADGEFDVGFTYRGTEELNESQEMLLERIFQYVARPGDEEGSNSILASLEAFEVKGARVVVEDHTLGITWFLPRMDLSLNSTNEGLEAGAYVQFPGSPGQVSDIRASMLFDWNKQDVGLIAQVRGFDARMIAGKISELAILHDQDFVFDAQIEAALGPDLMPRTGRVQISSPAGVLDIPEFSDAPVPYKDMFFEAAYDGAQKKLDVTHVQISAGDVVVHGGAELTHTASSVTGPVKIRIDDLQQAQIGPLWPAALKGDSSEEWIVKKMSDGTFHDVFAQMNLKADKTAEGWAFDAQDIKAGFSFDGMSVDYRAPLYPAKKAKGKGTFDYASETLSVDLESATIGDLSVTEGQLKFVDIIKVGKGVADVNLKIAGPLKTGIEYVSLEPISLKHPFDVKKVKGNMAAAVNVKFPTVDDIKIADVKVAVEGKASDVTLPNVVKTLELTGGKLAISVKGEDFNVKGAGNLAGRPVNFEYKEFLSSAGKPYKNKVAATITVDPELRQYFGIDLSEFLEGPADVALVYTEFEGGQSQAEVTADLTKARLFAKPFDYEKLPGVKGTTTLTAILQDGIAKQIKGLTASAPKLVVESTDLFFKSRGQEAVLSQGKISRFAIDETVGSAEFSIADSGAMTVAMDSQFLDLRPFLNNDDTKDKVYDDPPMKISVAADRMRMAEGETVQYGKVYVDIDKEGRFNQMEMDATAGKGDIYLRFKPDASGKRVFRFEADDAGATLRAFGLYNNVQGGTMTAYAEPIDGIYDRNLVGTAEMQNFKVVKAPALARLLGALSLPGLMNLLGDEGITFSKMEAKFDWLYRTQGSLMVLKDGRTSGNSLGLTFEGTFDKAAGNVDVSGTLVPLSGVNEIIGAIPLLGDILTGGSGGVFAATYTIKGKAEQPEIFVNPLSILTPGILRRILFE